MKLSRWIPVILLLYAVVAQAENIDDKIFQTEFYRKIDPIIKLLIDDVHHERFHSAIDHADELIKIDPDHPVGYFLKAAIYDNIILDYSDYRFETNFEEVVNKAISLANKRLKEISKKKLPPDHWLHFYAGGSLGFRGLHRFFKNEWFAAFSDGLNGIEHLQESLNIYPEMYDAYYGLGNFHYWVSAKSRFLWFLPFVKDERKRGMEELFLAIHKGIYTSIEARYAFLRILNNEKLYKAALKNANQLNKQFPGDVFTLEQKGFALRGLKRWKDASDTYTELISMYIKSQFHCFEKICEIAYLKAESLENINQTEEIETLYRLIMNQKDTRRKAGEKITKTTLKHIQGITKIRNSAVNK